MSRLLTGLLGMGLLGALVGCHCMHGVCDCDPLGPSCPPWQHAAPAAVPAPAAVTAPTKPAPIPAPAPEAPKPDK
jgi:hypothetical protein